MLFWPRDEWPSKEHFFHRFFDYNFSPQQLEGLKVLKFTIAETGLFTGAFFLGGSLFIHPWVEYVESTSPTFFRAGEAQSWWRTSEKLKELLARTAWNVLLSFCGRNVRYSGDFVLITRVNFIFTIHTCTHAYTYHIYIYTCKWVKMLVNIVKNIT